jgi:hypothetical protein
MRRRKLDPAEEAQLMRGIELERRVDRATDLLMSWKRAGIVNVPLDEVLRMLGAGTENGGAGAPPSVNPQADPMTGCLPVTAPGPPAAR